MHGKRSFLRICVFFSIAVVICIQTGSSDAAVLCPSNAKGLAGNGEPFTCQCSDGLKPSTVWGTDLYTDDSDICGAAIHAGLIDRSGGVVTFEVATGADEYSGSERNGLSSDDWGNWNRSFRFVASSDSQAPETGSNEAPTTASTQSVVSTASLEQSPVDRGVQGIWKGTYVCGQGLTGLTLTIEGVDLSQLTASFKFYPVPENPGVPNGELGMIGEFDPNMGQLEMRPGEWVRRPSGYATVGVTAALDTTAQTLTGRLLVGGCKPFELTRASPPSASSSDYASEEEEKPAIDAATGNQDSPVVAKPTGSQMHSSAGTLGDDKAPEQDADSEDKNTDPLQQLADDIMNYDPLAEDDEATLENELAVIEDELDTLSVLVRAGTDMTAECHALAGHPSESGNSDVGKPFDQIDTLLAIPACQRAVAEDASDENFYRLGRALDKAEEYGKAIGWYRKAAGQGYADAQRNLGVLYYLGQGVDQDYAEAARWFRLAADQGDVDSQFNLGLMYRNELGVAQDYAEAARLYRLAADQGDADSQFNLGTLYETGQGTNQDIVEAARLYRLAADQGNVDAQYNLGVLYEEGRGVDQDYAEAARWYRKAADQGYAEAQDNLGLMYYEGRGVDQDVSAAFMWISKAAEQGLSNAQRNLVALGLEAILGVDSGASTSSGGGPDGEWQAEYWCEVGYNCSFTDGGAGPEQWTVCENSNGQSWSQHWSDPCYGVEGWCNP